MTLRFIEFKTNELQNSELQPATSPSVASSGLKDSGSNDSAESNFEELNCFTQSFFELIKFIIRCWTFDVRCMPIRLLHNSPLASEVRDCVVARAFVQSLIGR